MSCMDLVKKRWSKILYLPTTLLDSLVEDTPIDTEWVSLLIWPTKSSPLKHQCSFGLRCFEFHSKCKKEWCLATMWNDFLSFSKDHALSQA